MKLSKIIENVDCTVYGDKDIDILELYDNSKEVKANGLFFAIDGTKVDGKDFAFEAAKNGAIAVVSSSKIEGLSCTNIVCSDVRVAMSLFACNFYNNPSKDMFVVGVTGTNGKTTTTFMLESIFKTAGKKVAVVGTNGIFINGIKVGGNLTTPDPIYMQKIMSKMRADGVEVVCMEVSAHALYLQKLRGVMTDVALFTNLTQDHLDFFLDMENYGAAKALFFTPQMAKYAVINYDDDFGRRLAGSCQIPALSYSKQLKNDGVVDIIAKGITHTNNVQEFDIVTPKGSLKVKLKLGGSFNVSNALGAISAGLLAGIDLQVINEGLSKLESVEGRYNTYDVNGVNVIVDYAHTPDGILNILSAAKEQTEGKVICVFGCGGNRDSAKRPIMGQIASTISDYVVITNDNPRFERPEDIAREIENGIESGTAYSIELDRAKAIKLAISLAKQGDSVVVAGKGAEPYMDMLGVKSPYSDQQVIENILSELKK